MVSETTFLESTTARQQAAGLLQGWGRLDLLDEHDHETRARYDDSIEAARPLAGKSIAAAALVDIEVNGNFSNIADKLKAVKDVATILRGWELAFSEYSDETALVLGENDGDIALISTSPVRLRLAHLNETSGTHPVGSWVNIDALDMTYVSAYGGKLHLPPSSSHYDRATQSGGGSKGMSVPLHELAEGHYTGLHDLSIPPVVVGRAEINELFSKIATRESYKSVTEHRSRTLSYALWRIRHQDPALARNLEAVVDKLGLQETWRGQYRTETAAKVAHVLREGYTAGNYTGFGHPAFHFKRFDSFLGDSEATLLRSTEAEMKAAIQLQCGRLGVSATGEEIGSALLFVTTS